MSLPKLSLPVHVIELPITKEKIDIQPYVIKNEKSLLTSLDENDKAGAMKIFKMLIDECVLTEDFDVTKLNIVDFYYLILNIRMKSNGEIIDGLLPCDHCHKKTEFEINLEDSIVIKNKDNIKTTVKINDELTLRLIPSNIECLFAEGELNVVDLVASSIDTVIINKKIYNNTSFTKDELIENIFCIFTKKDYDSISKAMENLARLYISFKYSCVNCGGISDFETDDVSNFN